MLSVVESEHFFDFDESEVNLFFKFTQVHIFGWRAASFFVGFGSER